MNNDSSQARILDLLYVLLSKEVGCTREDIYQQVKGYQEAPSESAKRRVFERDMQCLRASRFSIAVERKRPHPTIYKALLPIETIGTFKTIPVEGGFRIVWDGTGQAPIPYKWDKVWSRKWNADQVVDQLNRKLEMQEIDEMIAKDGAIII